MRRAARRLSRPTRAIRRELVGFDVEIAELDRRASSAAHRSSCRSPFTSLDQSAKRGDFDIGLSGIEDTPARRQSLAATIPYYEFREVLTVRAGRSRAISHAGRSDRASASPRSAARSPTTFFSTPSARMASPPCRTTMTCIRTPTSRLAASTPSCSTTSSPIARCAATAGLATHPDALAIGHYIVITAPENTALRDQVDAILRDAMRDGTLEAIFRKWNVWNDDQPKLYARRARTAQRWHRRQPAAPPAPQARWHLTRRYLPSLFRAAVITLVLSCLGDGAGRRARRVDCDRAASTAIRSRAALLTVYVEVMRGTPVLLQLFVIYYGLAS